MLPPPGAPGLSKSLRRLRTLLVLAAVLARTGTRRDWHLRVHSLHLDTRCPLMNCQWHSTLRAPSSPIPSMLPCAASNPTQHYTCVLRLYLFFSLSPPPTSKRFAPNQLTFPDRRENSHSFYLLLPSRSFDPPSCQSHSLLDGRFVANTKTHKHIAVHSLNDVFALACHPSLTTTTAKPQSLPSRSFLLAD